MTPPSAADHPARRPTVLEIDLNALVANYRAATALAEGLPVLCVVKANAYGHGLVPVSRALLAAGATHLGVATVAEGEALRRAGIDVPVLLLGGYTVEDAEEIVALGLTPALFSRHLIKPLSSAAEKAGSVLAVHVKVDTGMGRIGFTPGEAPDVIDELSGMDSLLVEGVFTHFAEADLADSPAAAGQLEQFASVRAALGEKAENIPFWHAANSAALMRKLTGKDSAFPATLFRPGIMLYGAPPGAGFSTTTALSPVATWKARVIQVKEVPEGTSISYGRTFVTRRPSRIATLPVGYADGFRRHLSNRGQVLLQGQRVPVAGRVCMDMIMVDVTDLPGPVSAGDEAVLIGRQGEAEISATEIGTASGTISYDILCGISERVPRRYLPSDR